MRTQPLEAKFVPELDAAIRTELAEEPNRHSSIDRDAVRGGYRRMLLAELATIEPQLGVPDDDDVRRPEPTLVARLRAHGAVIDASIGRLDALILAHPTKATANQRYAPIAHEEANKAFKAFTTVRRKIEKRLGGGETDRKIKQGCSVGDTVTPESPIALRDRLSRMIATLADAKFKDRFVARDIDTPLLLSTLRKRITALESAIRQPVREDITRGENAELIDREARYLDVAIERLLSFLEDYAPEEAMRGVERDVPRNRRAGDRRGGGGEGEEGGGGGGESDRAESRADESAQAAAADAQKENAPAESGS